MTTLLLLLLAVRAFTKDVAFPVVYTPSIVYTKAAVRTPEECEKDLLLDLYEPANKDKQRPAVVLMHGGAFQKGDRVGAESFADTCFDLAARGYVCASIDYRLEGDDPPGDGATLRERTRNAAMDDTVAAFQWLKRNAAKYRVDPSRIALGGASAGGVLALRIAYSPRGRALGIRAVLALSAAGNEPLNDAMRPNDPPLLIVHGTNDTLLPFANAVALDAQATKAGLPHRFVHGEGRGNGHIRRMQLPINGLTLLDHIVSFFNDYLAPKERLHGK